MCLGPAYFRRKKKTQIYTGATNSFADFTKKNTLNDVSQNWQIYNGNAIISSYDFKLGITEYNILIQFSGLKCNRCVKFHN
jgi:selenophosphate synthase